MADELRDEWGRFIFHWTFSSVGFFMRSLLPVLASWQNPHNPVEYPRWWAALAFGAAISLAAGIINSNLPMKPREMLKSIGLGFALNAATVLSRLA
jgi:hypothetical protein